MQPYHDSQRALPVYAWPLILLLVLAGILLGRFSGSFFGSSNSTGINTEAEPRTVAPRGNLAEDERSTIDLFKQTSPSVVHITTLAVRQDHFSYNLLQIPQGTGTGFIWDKEGHIVTNFHVIQEADAAQVTMSDQLTWSARLVGAYPDKDLAVLIADIPQNQLRPVPLGSSHDLEVGQKVFAIGNPFGLDQSLTTGIISALGREIESVTRRPIKDMIQTDAAINPGNSGGPLLDSSGRLIGVNAAIYSPSGAYAGIGFAIPVDEVNRVVPQLIRHGKVTRPGLGVQVAPDQLVQQAGLTGVLIRSVAPNSPAAKAGLQGFRRDERGQVHPGDLIIAVQGKKIDSLNQLLDELESHQVGSKVSVTILRDGREQIVPVTLEVLP